MSDYSVVNGICRTRARSGNYKIAAAGQIIGTGESESEPEPVIHAIHEHDDGALMIEIKLNRHAYRMLRKLTEQQGHRGMRSILSRALGQTILFLQKKAAAAGAAE